MNSVLDAGFTTRLDVLRLLWHLQLLLLIFRRLSTTKNELKFRIYSRKKKRRNTLTSQGGGVVEVVDRTGGSNFGCWS